MATHTTVRLYELAAARDILDQFLAETDGEETPAIADLFAQLEGQVADKVEHTALWIREQEATAKAIREEEQRLAARRRAIENAVERTKSYLQAQMETLGRDKVHGLLCTVALQNNPPSVRGELDEQSLRDLAVILPDVVKRVPETVTLDRRAVLAYYKEHGATPDERLTVEQSRSLRIR
jgi:hypothetical protein